MNLLHLAVYNNECMDVIKFLIARGIDVNSTSMMSCTPLIFATTKKKPSINLIKILL